MPFLPLHDACTCPSTFVHVIYLYGIMTASWSPILALVTRGLRLPEDRHCLRRFLSARRSVNVGLSQTCKMTWMTRMVCLEPLLDFLLGLPMITFQTQGFKKHVAELNVIGVLILKYCIIGSTPASRWCQTSFANGTSTFVEQLIEMFAVTRTNMFWRNSGQIQKESPRKGL